MVFRSQREELSTEAILFFAAVYRSKYDRKPVVRRERWRGRAVKAIGPRGWEA